MALFASAVRKGQLLRGDLHVPNLSVVILRHFEGEKRAGTDHVCDEKNSIESVWIIWVFWKH